MTYTSYTLKNLVYVPGYAVYSMDGHSDNNSDLDDDDDDHDDDDEGE